MTWHDGSIPAEKVYLKLGGDHGQGSMKMEFQNANVPKLNSPQNTVVFALSEGKDTRNNLPTILDGYQEQVRDLNSTTWRYAQMLFSGTSQKQDLKRNTHVMSATGWAWELQIKHKTFQILLYNNYFSIRKH